MTTQRFVPDTNFFLQAKSAAELPWHEISDATTVELVLVDGVITELDSHKGKGNARSARRAKKTFQLLDALFDGAAEVVVRKSKPKVVVRLAPDLVPGSTRPPQLDLTTTDGRVVEQALAVARALDGELTFLSNDRMPLLAARRVGLASRRLPDTWMSPPEPDDRDKRVAALEAEIKQWQSRTPNLDLQLRVGGVAVETIEGSLPRYLPLRQDEVEDVVAIIEGRHPEKSRGISGQFTLSYEADWEEYLRKREEWLKKIRRLLELYPRILTMRDGLFPIELVLSNIGAAPAEGLVVDVSLDGPLRFINPRRNEDLFGKVDLTLPEPPEPPRLPRATDALSEMWKRGHRREELGPLFDWDRFRAPASAREPMEFYWDYGPDVLTATVSGTCGDFRHGVATERLPMQLFLPAEENRTPAGCLRIRYSAKNLSRPLEKTVPIRLASDLRDCEPVIRALVIGE